MPRLARLLLAALTALAAAGPARADDLLVFAAASLATALDRALAGWERSGGAPVAVSYAATSALARQIEAGAPADLFVAASEDWMDTLERGGLLRAGSRRDLLGNTLVLVRHGAGAAPGVVGAGFDLAEELGTGRLAMAMVDSVPAGIYGREALVTLDLWDDVEAQVAQAADVRAALAFVALGEAPLGIVYATDARAEPAVSVAATFPAGSHAPIVYPAALTAAGTHPEAAALLDYLAGPQARAIFAAEGFSAPGGG